MGHKEMEGDNRERRKMAKEARDAGKQPSEIGATLGASKQRTKADSDMTHQEKMDLKRQGKQLSVKQNTPQAEPGDRDEDTLDHERYPRL